MRRALSLALPLLFAAPAAPAGQESLTAAAPPPYPDTRRVDAVEERFGRRVADPYRWPENDVRTDGDAAAWAAAQNRVTEAYLAPLPGRDILRNATAAS